MSTPFIAEIRMFGGNFAPRGWATCDGQLMSIAQNTALFSLLGTNFGGDGKVTFGLPNMKGNAPVCMGQGPGLSDYVIGQEGGSPTVTLIVSEIPLHNHGANAVTAGSDQLSPTSNFLAGGSTRGANRYAPVSAGSTGPFNQLGPAGSSLPHENMQPYLAVTYIIALEGIFPSRG